MQIKVGLEEGFEGRSLAWALDFPGCFAYGPDGTAALMAIPRALLAYREWIQRRAAQPWLQDLGDFDVRLVEVWNTYSINEQYETAPEGKPINAWFRLDWRPLRVEDVRRGALLMQWAHADLLEVLQDLSPEQLDRPRPGERWTLRGILAHVATSLWWLLERLDLAGVPRSQLPKEPAQRLQEMLFQFQVVLPDLAGVERVIGKEGEFWSPRKLLRRAVWHAIDHRQHILQILASEQ